MKTTTQNPSTLSPRAAALRNGIVPYGPPTLRAAAAAFAARLSAIAADPEPSTRERRAEAQSAIADFRRTLAPISIGATAAVAELDTRARRIESVVSEAERRLAPLQVERIRRRVAELERSGEGVDYRAALDTRDLDALWAATVLDRTGAAHRALAASLAPDDLAWVLDRGVSDLAGAAVVGAVAKAAEELAAHPTPWAQPPAATASASFAVANEAPARVLSEHFGTSVQVPPGWSPWLVPAVAGPLGTAPAPRPNEAPSAQPATAEAGQGGAS